MRAIPGAVAFAALGFLSACEKAEDRAAARLRPHFDIQFCASQSIDAPTHLGAPSCVASKNNAFVLVMQPSGALELAQVTPTGAVGEVLWTSASRGRTVGSAGAEFQSDGNLVVYDAQKPIWDSHSFGPIVAYDLTVTDDGNLVIHDSHGQSVWTTKLNAKQCRLNLDSPGQLGSGDCLASPSRNYAVVVRPSGVIEVATAAPDGSLGRMVWTSSNRPALPGAPFLSLQSDGNLVIYAEGRPLWDSHTNGRQGMFQLQLTDQGDLRLRDAKGTILWTSGAGKAKN